MATHLRVLVPLVLLFSFPTDLLSDWGDTYIAQSSYPEAVKNLFLALSLMLYSLISCLGYVAIAWGVREIIEGERPSISMALSKLAGRTLGRLFGTMLYAYWRILWPLLVFAIVFLPIAIFSGTFLLYYVLGILICIPFVVWNALNYTLLLFPTLFEHRYFAAAAERSKFLVTGRRVWLFFVLCGEVFLGVTTCVILIFLIPQWLKWPDADPHHWVGLLRSLYDSVTSSLVTAIIVVFDTLIYFRLRREKGDLTFFDLSSTAVLEPARVIAKAE